MKIHPPRYAPIPHHVHSKRPPPTTTRRGRPMCRPAIHSKRPPQTTPRRVRVSRAFHRQIITAIYDSSSPHTLRRQTRPPRYGPISHCGLCYRQSTRQAAGRFAGDRPALPRPNTIPNGRILPLPVKSTIRSPIISIGNNKT